ncbi:hypothetical protein B0H12DRAFT_770167 [Mycena haematopus]|nr:hypothetical protein B0H12DRAFT_770167 [Mycena haematopus]
MPSRRQTLLRLLMASRNKQRTKPQTHGYVIKSHSFCAHDKTQRKQGRIPVYYLFISLFNPPVVSWTLPVRTGSVDKQGARRWRETGRIHDEEGKETKNKETKNKDTKRRKARRQGNEENKETKKARKRNRMKQSWGGISNEGSAGGGGRDGEKDGERGTGGEVEPSEEKGGMHSNHMKFVRDVDCLN